MAVRRCAVRARAHRRTPAGPGPARVEDYEEAGPLTAGPFYPEEPDITDITGSRTGVPLDFEFRVVDVAQDCPAVVNAEVDLWHADANLRGCPSEHSGLGSCLPSPLAVSAREVGLS